MDQFSLSIQCRPVVHSLHSLLCREVRVWGLWRLAAKSVLCVGAQVTYSTLMEGFARQGNVAAVQNVFSLMTAQNLPPNLVVYNILLRVTVLNPPATLQVIPIYPICIRLPFACFS